jgi:hypothetical protein
MSTTNTEPCEKEKRINKDMATLWQWMGDRTFWANLNKVRAAKKGVAIQFLLGEFVNPERVENNFNATMLEFTRRATMIGVLNEI